MGGANDGRVVIITGAGGGIGREHALAFARDGASVVVNDVGVDRSGSGGNSGPAQSVVDEILASGGKAVANTDDISSMAGAQSVIDLALATFGELHVVVNNAGILRDRMLVGMVEDEWDAVMRVHLKGTYAMSHLAADYWRGRSKAGAALDARIINTSSGSGLFGNVGQSNYGAAKAGIAAFSVIAAQELARYGVTVNAIAPNALTRMTEDLAPVAGLLATPDGKRDLDPANMSPLVVWLGSPASHNVTGRVFSLWGTRITVLEGWANGPAVSSPDTWSQSELSEVIPDLVARARPNAGPDGSVAQ